MWKLKLFNMLLVCVVFAVSLTKLKASEDDLYSFTWLDKDKEVYVLQNRVFRKDGRFHLNLSGGLTTSGPFVDSTLVQVRTGFFFSEELGVEAIYSKNFGKENNIASSVRNVGGSGSIPFRRIVDSYIGGMLLWAPFYSKVNAFNKIFYMDWIFGLGMASLTETNNSEEAKLGSELTQRSTEKHTGLIWELSAKFYLGSNWEVRTDLTAVHYSAQKAKTPESAVYSNWDVGLGLGYSF